MGSCSDRNEYVLVDARIIIVRGKANIGDGGLKQQYVWLLLNPPESKTSNIFSSILKQILSDKQC